MGTGFCQFSPEDRVAYAYGELPAERHQAFAQHLADCRTCALEVAELLEAAQLCQTLRTAELPEPRFSNDQAPVPKRPFWRRPLLFWTPVAAAAAAAVLLVILLNPGPRLPTPNPTPPPDRRAVATLPVQVAAVEGATGLQRALDGREEALALGSGLHPGDVLVTGEQGRVTLRLEDGSQLTLEPHSQLALTSVSPAGDRFGLDHGSLACQVTPRSSKRPFSIEAPEASVRVVGTRFTVTRNEELGVEVQVKEGMVALTPSGQQAEPVFVRANEGGRVAPDGEVALSKVAVATPSAPGQDPLKPDRPSLKIAKIETEPGPARKPAPAPVEPTVPDIAPPPEDLRPPRSHAPESLEALVARLHEDTAWIFDQFRADMKSGRYSDVLRKLDNYLSDPDSPKRDEATFLKAICLEKLDRKPEALRTYRDYLNRWPTGQRAKDCRASVRRIWSQKVK